MSSYDSDDDLIEISAMDCQGFVSKKKRKGKGTKVVPHDIIEIDEDEDAIIIEKDETSIKGKETLTAHDNNQENPAKVSFSRVQEVEEDATMKTFRLFKRFDTVHDYSDHHYATSMNSTLIQATQKGWAKKIQQEWQILENNLPDTIFVRVYEERMDLLRSVIVGVAGTPYHDGLFFFDLYFPPSYPNVPPNVYYHSGGLRLNPNLYNCGNVCLSLLNTWSGLADEMWNPSKSTVLQVLLSIQGLVLNEKPYFNEPGFASSAGSMHGEVQSQGYNENTYILSCKTMLYTLRRPPKHFEDFIIGHFRECALAILVACKGYMDGAQVGCLVGKGKSGGKSCSQNFKLQVAQMVESLVAAFIQNGAEDCVQFLSLTDKKNGGRSTLPTYNTNGFPSVTYDGFPTTSNNGVPFSNMPF